MSLILSGTDGLSDVDGSAATPAIRGTDANTGIFFPAADTIAFSEGGTESMRINSSGNVGIGTTSPSGRLHVFGNVGDMLRLDRDNIGAVGNQIAFRHSNAGTLTETAAINAISTANADTGTLAFYTKPTGGSNTERARIDSSGNFGLGVTPSAWRSNYKATQVGNAAAIVGRTDNNSNYFSSNWYVNSSNQDIYQNTGFATIYSQASGAHIWYTAASGTAGNTISFTQAMTLDASGNLGIGTTSPAYPLDVVGAATGAWTLNMRGRSADNIGYMRFSSNNGATTYAAIGTPSANTLAIEVNGAERARITSGGNLLVGTTSGTTNTFYNGGAEATRVLSLSGASQGCAYFFVCDGGGESASATAIFVKKNSSTNRSINAGGTVNASGADYAEYMTKSGDFTVAKGDVVGINAQGKLTNVFADAVSFCVKSTDPSYVGGDTWGSGFEDDEEGLEAARQLVDRIAFAGQVPVNVTGAIAGQYIIPINDNGAIKGEAVSNPTFEQYQIAVGKVIAIESDGRAKIIVKVA